MELRLLCKKHTKKHNEANFPIIKTKKTKQIAITTITTKNQIKIK
jgi:hypothetical protein